MMSNKYFTHATPTLFNAERLTQLNYYLIAMESDSIKGIYNTLGDCAAISKWAGGIGMHIHNIRGSVVISAEQMELATVLFLCCEYLIIRRGMLIKEAEDVMAALPFTWNRGIQTSWNTLK